ncbi:alpha/beta hydrolase [Deferribacter thermophilus]|uniref:YqiA/YcfP family alpha/beta fold hydrolase n=1 Tax=Deferribacter thermophilus TaxID=53573 RepID=UPI003C2A27E9
MKSLNKTVIFSHGKEGTPDGKKIKVLSGVAKSMGWECVSLDYRGVYDPEERVKKLESFINSVDYERLVLVGSSMGGYVSLAVAKNFNTNGLFLLAPAIGMKNLEYKNKYIYPENTYVEIVHGLKDSVVPVDNIIFYSKKFGVTLHLLNDGHRLLSSINYISKLFKIFLEKIDER